MPNKSVRPELDETTYQGDENFHLIGFGRTFCCLKNCFEPTKCKLQVIVTADGLDIHLRSPRQLCRTAHGCR